MNKVPKKLKDKWRLEDIFGEPRVCLRASEGNCQGRLTKEHAMYFAGKQIQEEWAILDICEFHHGVNGFQDRGDLQKEKHVWLALNRAPEDRLVALSKATNYIELKGRLNQKYGIYEK